MKRILAITLAAVMLFAFCPALTGLRADAAAPAKTETKAAKEAEKLPIEGEYTLFAVENIGRQLDPDDLGMSGKIILSKNGTGKLTSGGTDLELTEWTEKNGTVMYFAREGVDTKDFTTSGHPTDSLLYAFFSKLDSEKGVHLHYQRHVDYMDATTVFDAHAKGESYYALETTSVKGYSSDKATLYKDGTVYLLYPKEKRRRGPDDGRSVQRTQLALHAHRFHGGGAQARRQDLHGRGLPGQRLHGAGGLLF